MAEAARTSRANATGSVNPGFLGTQPANDNAIPSPTRLAMRLQSDRLQDRKLAEAAGGDTSLRDDSLQDISLDYQPANDNQKVLLELDTQSYATPQSAAGKEKQRQARMMQEQARFLQSDVGQPGRARAEEAPQVPASQPSVRPGSSDDARGIAPGSRYQRLRSAIAEAKQDLARSEKIAEESKSLEREVVRAKRLYSLFIKVVSAFTAEAIFPLIWLVICLNIESWNILLFRRTLPDYINTPLNMIGLNIAVDKNNPFTPSNLLILLVTGMVNIFFFLVITLLIVLLLFIIFLITEFADVIAGVI